VGTKGFYGKAARQEPRPPETLQTSCAILWEWLTPREVIAKITELKVILLFNQMTAREVNHRYDVVEICN
jgi:hypothetical protein